LAAIAMSSSSPLASIHLRALVPGIALSVLNAQFIQVAQRIDALDADVAPGIYELRYEAGPSVMRKLVTLGAGESYVDNQVAVPFPSAAPIRGSSTSDEHHFAAVVQASRELSTRGGGLPSAILLMVRNLRGQEELPLARIADLELLSASLAPVEGFALGWRFDPQARYAIWSREVQPGGYVLRTRRPTAAGAVGEAVDLCLWASNGWQTLVFVPNLETGPAPEWCSVHMSRLGMAWDPGMRPEVEQALELALWGLRAGRANVPIRSLANLLDSKFQNPMLGIVGAHLMLLGSDTDFGLLDQVLRNLGQLIPDHPDRAALDWIRLEQRKTGTPVAGRRSLAWPPTLMASYAGALRRDAVDPGAIVDGSVAERVAAQLVTDSVWTMWHGLSDHVGDAASRRVTRYLAEAAAVMRDVGELTDPRATSEVSLGTGLPTSTVTRAMEDAKSALRNARILWVDDTPDNNSAMHRLLRGFGSSVELARSTDEATDFLGRGRYDIVISDMQRDRVSDAGSRLIAWMWDSGVRTPVIIYLRRLDPSGGIPEHAFGITNRPDQLLGLIVDAVKHDRM
jgi:hypothetical protein